MEVISNGVKTVAQLLNDLFAIADYHKIRSNSVFIDVGEYATYSRLRSASTLGYIFDHLGDSTTNVGATIYTVSATSSVKYGLYNDLVDHSSAVPTAGSRHFVIEY